MKKSLWILLAAAFALYGCGYDSDDNDCGNGTIDAGEECDDGNNYNGDGCSSVCRIEKVSATCGNGQVEPGEGCDDGNKVDGDGCSAKCTVEVAEAVCGNGKIENDEECDDGNTTSGDGCSSSCKTEVVAPVCGNGKVEAGEECDDGNKVNGDGCHNDCTIEYLPDPEPVCGNGKVEDGEECDDGNKVNGDGCSAICEVETPGTTPVCGNGKVEEGEDCDDGNKVNGDGCHDDCTIEYLPDPEPVCGNGKVEDGEECDDGNKVNGDGCSAICETETPGTTPVCGNGKVEEGEDCDGSASGLTCVNYDSAAYTSGNVICSECKYDFSACVPAETIECGNGILEGDEECDWTDSKGVVITEQSCSSVVPGSSSGKATCKSCKLDTSACAGGANTGLYWCQLMTPVELTFDDLKTSEVVVARYGIGDDITESAMSAELVFGAELNTMSTLWKAIPATQNTTDHSFTATLSSAALKSLKDADGKSKFYYTFEIKEDGDADARYCRRNTSDKDPAVENGSLKPVLFDAEDKDTIPVAYDLGVATVSSTASSAVVAKFTFARGKYDDGNVKFTSATASTYAADEGSGSLFGSGIQCSSSNCFAGGTDPNLNVKNWKASKAEALSGGANLQIKGLDTRGTSGNIKLEMDVWRNANDASNATKNSATSIVVLYSADGGKSFTEYGEIGLEEGDKNIKKFFSYDMTLGNDAKNLENLWLKLVPYGGNNLNRFDNIVISKNN